MDQFTGFSPEGAQFYRELALENTREFWLFNRARYENDVRLPMELLLAELEPEFGPAKMFRPNRDLRFSADKSPYKINQGAYVPSGPAQGWYLELSGSGVLVGGGFYHAPADQLGMLRNRINTDGAHLRALLSALEDDGWIVGGERLKTAPKGYSQDHPYIDLLRRKTLVLGRDYGEDPVVTTPGFVDVVRADWQRLRPLIDWLGDALGYD